MAFFEPLPFRLAAVAPSSYDLPPLPDFFPVLNPALRGTSGPSSPEPTPTASLTLRFFFAASFAKAEDEDDGMQAENQENVSAKKEDGKKKERPRVPDQASEKRFWKLGQDAGLSYAKLTGDFNPIHWIPAAARASGFRNVILHGFATLAYACEGLNRGVFAGDVNALKSIDVRFTSPMVLPAKVGLYLQNDDIYVGDAPGGRAYLTGRIAK